MAKSAKIKAAANLAMAIATDKPPSPTTKAHHQEDEEQQEEAQRDDEEKGFGPDFKMPWDCWVYIEQCHL